MPDDADPPRKLYGFKPTAFERVNAPRPEPDVPPAPAGDTPSGPNESVPIDVRDLHQAASVPGPVLARGEKVTAPNEVHAVLRENLERARAAGLMDVAPRPARKSRRTRDYVLLMVSLNGAFAALATHGLRSGNAILFVYCLAGIGLVSASLTWVMWFVMDDY